MGIMIFVAARQVVVDGWISLPAWSASQSAAPSPALGHDPLTELLAVSGELKAMHNFISRASRKPGVQGGRQRQEGRHVGHVE